MRMFVIMLLFQILFLHESFPQNNVEIMDTTNVWYITQPITNKPDDYRVSILYFAGDTIINNMQYMNLMSGCIEFPNKKARYCGCLRSDTAGNVMWVPSYQNQEYLLYPKNFCINDKIDIYASFYGDDNSNVQTIVLISEDSIYSENRFLKSYSLQRSCEAKVNQKWISGIGSTNGLIWNYIFQHCNSGLPELIISGAMLPSLIALKNNKYLYYYNTDYSHLRNKIINHKEKKK